MEYKAMNPITNYLANQDRPFYFGCGGLGDFLLLMSTFYDDIEQNEVNVVFAANNHMSVSEMANEFPKINMLYLMPINALQMHANTWKRITEHEHFKGSGVTPKNFEYVEEWRKCRIAGGVFEYYGVNRQLNSHNMRMKAPGSNVVVQPFGGADDKTKVKEMTWKEIADVLLKYDDITFIGSTSEMQRIEKTIREHLTGFTATERFARIKFIDNLRDAMYVINACGNFVGVDSWGKTYAALVGVPVEKITVIPNQYLRPLKEMFGPDTIHDPGDYVFLYKWGFDLHDR